MENINFKIISKRPNTAGFPPDILSVDHPLTDFHISKNYKKLCPNNEGIVWANKNYCGIKIEDHEIAFRIENGKFLLTTFCTPAKGCGHVGLVIITDNDSYCIFQSKKYDKELINYANLISSSFKELCNFNYNIEDLGPDA